jgi:hypothetical protein
MAVTINASTSAGLVQTADTSGVLQLQTANTTAVTVDASQNVGIGTASPTNRLHVFGPSGDYRTALFESASTAGPSVQIKGSRIYELRSTNTGAGEGAGLFFIYDKTAEASRMAIDSSGYVRVNNTGGLDGQFSSLTGAFYAGAFANTDATITTVYSWNKATSGNNLFYQFYTDTGTLRGSIDYNRAGNAVRYNTTSDQRLKENIVDAPSAIDLINSVKIRSFDWKETGFHVDYGVIAQELNEVAPDAVSEGIDNEDGTIKQSWGVDTSVLVPALIKCIQEQQIIINDLKARIETLEAK